MKCLTVMRPWGAAMLLGYPSPKDVENRSWATRYRGPLLIHQGKRRDPRAPELLDRLPLADVEGAILGVVELRDCVRRGDCQLRWAMGPDNHWCWLLYEPRVLQSPLPWSGQQSLYDVPDEAVKAAVAAAVTPGQWQRQREQAARHAYLLEHPEQAEEYTGALEKGLAAASQALGRKLRPPRSLSDD